MKADSSTVQNVAIILRPGDLSLFTNLIQNLIQWLLKRKKNIYIFSFEQERIKKILRPSEIKKINFGHEKQMLENAGLVISLGGDGTLIGTVHLFSQLKVCPPIFGVNLGHLGLLTEFQKNEFFEELNQLFSGNIEIFQTDLFSVQIHSKSGPKISEFFLNDAVISKHHISRLFTLSVECNNEHITNISGDGLIISSPLGSTAYSLAAGGPIIHPLVQGLILTPICPHSLTHRPLVIPNKFSIKIRLISKTGHVILTVDGQRAYTLSEEDYISINKEKSKKINLVKNSNKTYFHTLKEKLFHGANDR